MPKPNEDWRKIEQKRLAWEKKIKKNISETFDYEKRLLIEYIRLYGLEGATESLNQTDKKWEETYNSLYSDVIADFVKFQIQANLTKQQFDFFLELSINSFIEQNTGRKITFIQNTTKQKINKIIDQARQEAQTASEVQEILLTKLDKTYETFSASRSLMIARTEVGGASSFGQFEAGRLSGANFKIWNTAKDPEVRPTHQPLNGVKVGINDKFPNGLSFPLDPMGAASEVINCRCSLSFE